MDFSPRTILIVTGAHLSAEINHRPIAYALREHIVRTSPDRAEEGVVVCSDLWYLNREELRGLPCISIGSPEVSALSAYLAARIPSRFVIDNRLMVQMSAEGTAPVASCWGVDEHTTSEAVDVFASRFLTEFLDACDEPA